LQGLKITAIIRQNNPSVLKQALCCGCIQFCLSCWCRYFDWQTRKTPFRNTDSWGNEDDMNPATETKLKNTCIKLL